MYYGARTLGCKEDCIVRRGVFQDFKQVCDVEFKCFDHPYPPRLIFTFITLFPEFFYVVDCKGVVVGYVIGFEERGGVGHVASIAVLPEYRGRGFGKALLGAIEKAFVSRGLRESVLEVSVENKVAINLYKKMGYVIEGRIKNYYPDGSDAFIMRKNLV